MGGAHGGVEQVVVEANAAIKLVGTLIASKYFKGELAGAPLTGDFFNQGQHFFGDALAPVGRQHSNIMNVDQGLAGKCRKTL